MRTYITSSGISFFYSEEDHEYVNVHVWYIHEGYPARTKTSKDDSCLPKTIFLHKELMNHKKADHIDRNRLNATRENLRVASFAENNRNIEKKSGKNTYKNVAEVNGRYYVKVRTDSGRKSFGGYALERTAAQVADLAVARYHGDFGVFNFGIPEYKLFLDDIRFPVDDKYIICRDIFEAMKIVSFFGCPSDISLDHDMPIKESRAKYLGKGRDLESWDGYYFAKWLVEQDLDGTLSLENLHFGVHSMNPIGAENIRAYLVGYLRSKYGNTR